MLGWKFTQAQNILHRHAYDAYDKFQVYFQTLTQIFCINLIVDHYKKNIVIFCTDIILETNQFIL